MRIAAIGDLHYRADSTGLLQHLLPGIEGVADLLILAGDLTDSGQPAEMQVLLHDLKEIPLRIIAVLGNHDHESDQAERLAEMLRESGITVLEGNVVEIENVGFVGTKGFCGGFDNTLIQPFGERVLKAFIQEGIDEAVQLENALARLDCERKVAVLHYAPIKATLAGESPELFPMLGCSRLANAVDRHGADLILHGHAHHGSPEGRTPRGIPVYNICRFVLNRFTHSAYGVFNV